jgi:tripartite-type tricarboxylate transporter receptor subunit TctC
MSPHTPAALGQRKASPSLPRRALLALVATLACGAAMPLQAQPNASGWPAKPVKLVVGYAAGGATDVIARLVAVKLGDQLGQPVVLYPKLGYDPVKDFEPIGMIAKIPNILVVNPKLPIKNLADYVRYAKESKDGITFASSGSGSSIHLSGEMFKMQSKLKMLHVPYRGSAPAVTDLLGGQVDSMFDNTPSALPHVQAGKLRAIAITSAQRSSLLPDVPTLAESGYTGFDVQSWFGLAAPAGTPRAVIEQVNAALNKVLAQPEVRTRLQELAATPDGGTPDKMRQFAAAEIKRWREVVKESGASAE